MPTYEYACNTCGHRVEVTQRIDDPPPTKCERCGSQLRKVFHPAGIVFKGSGFYATDSRAKPSAKKKDETKEKAPAGSTDKSTGGTGGDKGGETRSGDKKSDKKSSEGRSST
jgi:putative FmdB family regulatory protein